MPRAIPREVSIVPAVVAFTKKAPIKIAGMTLGPKIIMEARAIPVGGHTAVALAFAKASVSPNFPEIIYTKTMNKLRIKFLNLKYFLYPWAESVFIRQGYDKSIA